LSQDAKGQIENLEGIWIYELGELQGLNKSEISKVKAFASRQTDRARPAYGRFREDRDRRGIFIGTTNESEYLRDPTGNRRFLPVLTGKIDLDALQRDRDQLWAEAAHREAAGESITLPQELWELAATEQAGRIETDPWEMILKSRLDDPCHLLHGGDKLLQRVSANMLLSEYLKISEKDWRPVDYKRLAACMRRLGWDGPKNIRMGDQVTKAYERIKKDMWRKEPPRSQDEPV
jgi:predicted P-loop ATPase